MATTNVDSLEELVIYDESKSLTNLHPSINTSPCMKIINLNQCVPLHIGTFKIRPLNNKFKIIFISFSRGWWMMFIFVLQSTSIHFSIYNPCPSLISHCWLCIFLISVYPSLLPRSQASKAWRKIPLYHTSSLTRRLVLPTLQTMLPTSLGSLEYIYIYFNPLIFFL